MLGIPARVLSRIFSVCVCVCVCVCWGGGGCTGAVNYKCVKSAKFFVAIPILGGKHLKAFPGPQ